MPGSLSRPAPPRRQPLLYWPAVYVAGACALLLVGGMTVTLWAQSRPVELAVSLPEPAPPPPATVIPPPQPPPPPVVEAETMPVMQWAPRPPVCHAAKSYDTAVSFVTSPEEAAEQAKEEKKLLFVLHLSGNLEDDAFT